MTPPFSLSVTLCLLFSLSVLSEGCPSGCGSCDHGRIRCPGAGLSSLPQPLPYDVLTIDLTQNNIQNLDPLPDLQGLQSFRMSMNSLEIVQGGTFERAPNLMSLDLSMNRIRKVYKHGLRGLDNLMTISLNGNKMSEIDVILHNTPMIQSVRFGNNEITNIDNKNFENNKMIKMLDLSNNKISAIDGDAFKNLAMLRVLLLSNNPLMTLTDLTFTSTMLSLADFSNCDLTSVPKTMPPSLADYRLGNNEITTINVEDFENITSLKMLTLNDNKISHVDHRSFGSLVNLKELWMSRNDLVYVPRGLPKALSKLFMDNNQIVELEQMLFTPESDLIDLNLENNKIFKVHQDSLKDVNKLQRLNLQGNVITEIMPGTFTHTPKLESLELTHNPIQKFEQGAFKGLDSLTDVAMSFFESGLASEDQILPENIFEAMPNVTSIDIMSSIMLTRAFMAKIQEGNAAPLQKVKKINLQYNELNTLPENLKNVFPNAKQVLLDENMFVCDRNLLWLHDWMTNSEVSFHQYEKPTCREPESLKGREIESLARNEFTEVVQTQQARQQQASISEPDAQAVQTADDQQQEHKETQQRQEQQGQDQHQFQRLETVAPPVVQQRPTNMGGTRVIIKPPSGDRGTSSSNAERSSYSKLARQAARKAERDRKRREREEKRRLKRQRNKKRNTDASRTKRKVRNKKGKKGRKCEKDEDGNVVKCERKKKRNRCQTLEDGTVRCKKRKGKGKKNAVEGEKDVQ
ncbi:protein slit-like [Mya arenaria]|uniref:protein slit-like n=1 Tax=Mya arenaria TaxID=6604 RepID=UPI0022DF63BC|nr:protein slit-like [Mya arenaria]